MAQNNNLFSRIWSQLVNNVNQLIKRYYEVNETEDSLTVRQYVPGLRKEDVKIRVDHNLLRFTINGNGHGHDLTGKHYNIYQTKAHVSDDHELNIVVPKIKDEEERYQEDDDVAIHVNVE
ncbi:unnamed protein product [Trifolium pratense]|uniref:Uncharacterized protein n=1 Tax=Trifolium pratense TaxID=57577 RepID=A0ACB0JS83_TRIPR|nr:unnamed protein product [Trifolium pratense]